MGMRSTGMRGGGTRGARGKHTGHTRGTRLGAGRALSQCGVGPRRAGAGAAVLSGPLRAAAAAVGQCSYPRPCSRPRAARPVPHLPVRGALRGLGLSGGYQGCHVGTAPGGAAVPRGGRCIHFPTRRDSGGPGPGAAVPGLRRGCSGSGAEGWARRRRPRTHRRAAAAWASHGNGGGTAGYSAARLREVSEERGRALRVCGTRQVAPRCAQPCAGAAAALGAAARHQQDLIRTTCAQFELDNVYYKRPVLAN